MSTSNDPCQKFHPAFDMPGSPEQAIAVLQAWGAPSTMTFHHSKAARCASLLADAMKAGDIDPVLAPVFAEVERATRKFPTWPTDPLHALAVLGEEFGELTKAALQTVYEPHKVEPGELRTEAIQTAAMALRFLLSLDAYRFVRSEQHQQATPAQAQQADPSGPTQPWGAVKDMLGATPAQAPQADGAHEDKELMQALEERDAASDYIDALPDEVLGKDRPEWSSNYGHADAIDEVRKQKDDVYLERNRCVALIARMALALGLKAGVAKTAIEGWSEDWHGCVFIDLPEGQASWHYHDSQAGLFKGLPTYAGTWDGHSTPEKYERVAASYAATVAQAAVDHSMCPHQHSVDDWRLHRSGGAKS